MPGVVGAINVNSVEGVVRFGDSVAISPKYTEKVYRGSGASNTGDFIRVDNINSVTNVNDADISDQNQIGNA